MISNGVDENPSGQLDPRNTSISVNRTNVTLLASDGTKRIYIFSNVYEITIDKEKHSCCYGVLQKEILPNGKVLRYQYKNRQVVKVESLNPTEEHIYATLTFDGSFFTNELICKTNTDLQATYSHTTSQYYKKNKTRHLDLLYPFKFTNISTPEFGNGKVTNHTGTNNNSWVNMYKRKHYIFK